MSNLQGPAWTQATARPPMGAKEFVALMASLMVLTALSTAAMLPALPVIARELGASTANDRQSIVSTYFVGLGLGSLIYGPLSDRFGRRPVVAWSIALFLAGTALCAFAQRFDTMLLARFACGFFAAGARVVSVSIVRDRFRGDDMARVMSMIFVVFTLCPVVAPSVGQALLALGGWRWIFGGLFAGGAAVLVWMMLRLPETLTDEGRIGIDIASMQRALRSSLSDRGALGHTLAAGAIMGTLIAFLTSAQQIVFDVFHAPGAFALAFGAITTGVAVGSFANSRIVSRFGARRVSRCALIAMLAIAMLQGLHRLAGHENLLSFVVFEGLLMIAFSFTAPNLSALAMAPFQRGAGWAASLQSCFITVASAALGAFIGARFDGTATPLTLGVIACSAVALAAALWAGNGLERSLRAADA